MSGSALLLIYLMYRREEKNTDKGTAYEKWGGSSRLEKTVIMFDRDDTDKICINGKKLSENSNQAGRGVLSVNKLKKQITLRGIHVKFVFVVLVLKVKAFIARSGI